MADEVKKKRGRHVVECIWSGYRSSQSRVCHRRVYPSYPDRIAKISTITFDDGTSMSVDVRPCKLRENVKELRAYDKLIDDATWVGAEGYVRVSDIHEANERRVAELRIRPLVAPTANIAIALAEKGG